MSRKSVLNKKEMVVISSLIAIPLTTVLIAMVTLRPGKRSPKRGTLLRQARSETNTNTNNKTMTMATTTTTTRNNNNNNNNRQRKEEEEEEEEEMPSQVKSFPQESKTREAAQVTIAPTIPTNIASEDVTIPAAIAVIAPSPVEPSRSTGCATIVSSSHTREQELSISDEAKKAGESLKELIKAAIKDAKDSAKGTGKKIKEETVGIAATTDSKDIQSLGDNVDTLVGLFEKMMVEIRKEHYNEQIILLQSYKDLLRTQIKVSSARGMMASKLKPGA